jgi:hypothetical protein
VIWTIAFDFPDADAPVFAWTPEWAAGVGYTVSLAGACRFADETTAQQFLDSRYPRRARDCGVVVEVAQPTDGGLPKEHRCTF